VIEKVFSFLWEILKDMTLSDYFSLSAVLLSIFTLYWTALRKGRLISPAPRSIGLALDPNHHPRIGTTLFITNDGARPVSVDFLFAEIETADSKNKRFDCISEAPLQQAAAQSEPPTQETFPKPFQVVPKAAIIKDLVFDFNDNYEFPKEEFTIKFKASVVGIKKEILLTQRKVRCEIKITQGRFINGVATQQMPVMIFRT